MKKTYILSALLILLLLCCTACKDDTSNVPVNNDIQVSFQPDLTQNATPEQPSADDEQTTEQIVTELPTTQESTTQAGPAAVEKYRNEYTADGEPSVIYEVIGSGDNVAYSGVYSRYVYNSGMLKTVEKWKLSDLGDSLISTTDYSYDGRGNLTRTDERLPDAQGNLYTYCLTEMVINADGTVATKSVSYLNTDESLKQQTVFGYTYDSHGRQTLCTVIEDGTFISSTATEYVFSGSTLTKKTETATKYPDTPYEQTNVITQTFDANGNVLTLAEDDTGVHYVISYEYDAQNREVSSRTTLHDGSVSEYTITAYEDLGGGCTRITKRLFNADGALYNTLITCTDAKGNAYIPAI